MEDPNTYEGSQGTSTTDDPCFNSFPQIVKNIKCKLSLLSKPDEDNDTEQDPAESAVVQEPWLKRELLAQAGTSGHSIQQQQLSEPGQLETDTTQQPGENDIISFKPP